MKIVLHILILIVMLISCKKPEIVPSVSSTFVDGILLLNEGLFQQNNASLSFYSFASKTMSHTIFSVVNSRGLGDTANDMIAFTNEGKLYYAIAVNVSSQIEILDGISLKSIGQIGLFNSNDVGRAPRSLQYNNGLICSVNFDGTLTIIDFKTLLETKTVQIGQNPESSLIFNNRLYVVNTGGLNFPDYDSTISTIDLQTNTVINEFTAGLNGSNLVVDEQGEGYMISRGNYSDIKPKLVRLDLDNYSIIDEYFINPITHTYSNHTLYYYDDITNAIYTFDTENEQKSETALIDCSAFENVYKIIINEDHQLIYVIDANGYVNSSIIRIYKMNGDFETELKSGLNTNTIVFTP